MFLFMNKYIREYLRWDLHIWFCLELVCLCTHRGNDGAPAGSLHCPLPLITQASL